MSEQKTTAIQPAKSIDDVVALLKVDERTHVGQANHQAPEFPGSPAWIGYRGNKAKARLEELDAAGVPQNAYYLYDKGVITPKPFFIHLIASFHFYSTVDDDNNILEVSRYLNDAKKKLGYSDHVIGCALVRLPGTTPMFMAATFSQRKAMTRSFDDLRSVLKSFEADREGREFKARGERHRVAFETAKWPTFAVRAKIWGKTEPAKRPGGRDYNLGMAAIEPTPLDDVKALNRYMGFEPESYGGENKKSTEFANVLRSFGSRRAEIVEMLEEADTQEVKQEVKQVEPTKPTGQPAPKK